MIREYSTRMRPLNERLENSGEKGALVSSAEVERNASCEDDKGGIGNGTMRVEQNDRRETPKSTRGA